MRFLGGATEQWEWRWEWRWEWEWGLQDRGLTVGGSCTRSLAATVVGGGKGCQHTAREQKYTTKTCAHTALALRRCAPLTVVYR